ncbi:hypothetical protein Y032_0378g279 [Ancylostoma ceylanicum]|uniref:Uncharacterized protein n=1 Tax=Ancylostoma ceylanicum TaxID=53326 RepID=A0A016RTE2_9BILA|nr:hypothetical protein Y032_0378g279 [Ancylostoma ceylanicum]
MPSISSTTLSSVKSTLCRLSPIDQWDEYNGPQRNSGADKPGRLLEEAWLRHCPSGRIRLQCQLIPPFQSSCQHRASPSLATVTPVSIDCERSVEGLPMLTTGDRQHRRPTVADIGDRPSPVLVTVTTVPIDCGL